MRNSRWMLLGAGLLAAVLCGGCQTFSRDSVGGGPSRTFGLNPVPRQSEPPLEAEDAAPTTGTKTRNVQTASLTDPAPEDPAKPATALSRLLPMLPKERPKSQPLPVSSRAASAADAESLSDPQDE
ncbi:MAG: hypothetical protein HY290_07865 [Planctomycetia bacterium]|nr:hypothetical protein [Planctomycetia bacterium]